MAELRMVADLLQVTYPLVLISQTYHLRSLRVAISPIRRLEATGFTRSETT
jgi:hypothetical protein